MPNPQIIEATRTALYFKDAQIDTFMKITGYTFWSILALIGLIVVIGWTVLPHLIFPAAKYLWRNRPFFNGKRG